jgi:TonB family protein
VVTLAFEVDEAGHPMLIRVQEATEPVWGSEAVSFVRNWRFSPARKNGTPVRVPCTIDLVWGEKQFTQHSLQVAAATFRGLINGIAERWFDASTKSGGNTVIATIDIIPPKGTIQTTRARRM